ncbi:hypothetical protein M9458_018222, partial [Cirrhinus mrigala]
GEVISITRRVDDHWLEGRIAGTNRSGIFPVSYVQVNKMPRTKSSDDFPAPQPWSTTALPSVSVVTLPRTPAFTSQTLQPITLPSVTRTSHLPKTAFKPLPVLAWPHFFHKDRIVAPSQPTGKGHQITHVTLQSCADIFTGPRTASEH